MSAATDNKTLLLFGGRGMLVELHDQAGDLPLHAERLAEAADAALAGAEALASDDWCNNQNEIVGAIAGARLLMQLSQAAFAKSGAA